MAEYTKSIVSYFDILGFRRIVEESSSPEHVAQKLKALARFSSPSPDIMDMFGNTFTNFSDLVLRTTPIASNSPLREGAGLLYWELMDLVHVQAELVAQGVLLRGSITVGDIFIREEIVFGPALIRAYELESKVATAPRVIIDPEVFRSLEQYPSLRGHEIEDEMQYLCRVLKKDSDGVWFIDYLRAFESEANDWAAYLRFLKAHKQLIVNQLLQVKQLDSILTKYGWLTSYHNNWVMTLNDDHLDQLGESKEKLLVPDNFTPLLPSILEDPSEDL
jgi:hypothetical protein